MVACYWFLESKMSMVQTEEPESSNQILKVLIGDNADGEIIFVRKNGTRSLTDNAIGQ